jgi:hypothetical protein
MKLSIMTAISGILIFSCNNKRKPSAIFTDNSSKIESR